VRSALGWLCAAVVVAALLWVTSLITKGWTQSQQREIPKSY